MNDPLTFTRDPVAPALSRRLQTIADTIKRERTTGQQRLFRLAVVPADWRELLHLTAPTRSPVVRMLADLPVHYAPNASGTHLWVRANDGQLGNLKPVAIPVESDQ